MSHSIVTLAPEAAPSHADIPRSPSGKPFSLDEAYAYCEVIAHDHDNFPGVSRLLPTRLRRHVSALYAFVRSADDFADEPRFRDRRAELLDSWQTGLERAFFGEAEHPVFVALKDTVKQCDLPIGPLSDLLTAFRMDLSTSRYPTFSALQQYVAHSAHPIGRLMLYIFGHRDPALHRFSDDICSALHLTNFVQDVAPDLDRGRIYIPTEDLHHFGVDEDALQSRRMTDRLQQLFRFEAMRARSLLYRGEPLIGLIGSELRGELTMIWHGAKLTLEKLERNRYDVFSQRPTLHRIDKVKLLARGTLARLTNS